MPSLRTFVARLIQRDLLVPLLQRHKIELEDNALAASPTAVADAIVEAFADRPPGSRALLDLDVSRVDALANETGEAAIADVTLDEEVADLPSRHARALWLFLHDQRRFRQAEEAFYTDQKRQGREWTAFVGEKGRDLRRDLEAIEAFKEALRHHFQSPKVQVEIFERTRLGIPGEDDDGIAQLVQITIFREGWPSDEYAFDGLDLVTRTKRPVLEASVTYEPASGIMECVAKQKDSRAEVVRLMATTLLGASPDFQPVSAPAYDLASLCERKEFPTDPEDGVEEVRVAMMRLAPLDTSAETVVLESAPAAEQDIWSMAEQRLGTDALQSRYRIRQAKFALRYTTADNGKARMLTFTITQPHRSNLKELQEIERKVTGKYLPRWGLVSA